MAKIPQDGHSDPGPKPGMKNFEPIGSFGPVPSATQKFNHGHSPQPDLKHPKAPQPDTKGEHKF